MTTHNIKNTPRPKIYKKKTLFATTHNIKNTPHSKNTKNTVSLMHNRLIVKPNMCHVVGPRMSSRHRPPTWDLFLKARVGLSIYGDLTNLSIWSRFRRSRRSVWKRPIIIYS